MVRKMPAVVNLPAALEHGGTLRIILSSGARVRTGPGTADIEMLWRADVEAIPEPVIGKRTMPKFLGTFVTDSSTDETPADLLRQLADIYAAGELKVGG